MSTKPIYNFHCDWILNLQDLENLKAQLILLSCFIGKVVTSESEMDIEILTEEDLTDNKAQDLFADLGGMEADYRKFDNMRNIFPLRVILSGVFCTNPRKEGLVKTEV